MIINGASGVYTCKVTSDESVTPSNNLLKGSIVDSETVGADCLFYQLSVDDNQNVGFYWGADDGAAFINKANRAYLAVSREIAADIRYFHLGQPTGVQNQTVEPLRADVYSLSGVRLRKNVQTGHALDGLPSGIYIVNGKKVAK